MITDLTSGKGSRDTADKSDTSPATSDASGHSSGDLSHAPEAAVLLCEKDIGIFGV